LTRSTPSSSLVFEVNGSPVKRQESMLFFLDALRYRYVLLHAQAHVFGPLKDADGGRSH
jgi:hypothetical protein